MKKLISLILLFIITLSACSHNSEIPVGSGPITTGETEASTPFEEITTKIPETTPLATTEETTTQKFEETTYDTAKYFFDPERGEVCCLDKITVHSYYMTISYIDANYIPKDEPAPGKKFKLSDFEDVGAISIEKNQYHAPFDENYVEIEEAYECFRYYYCYIITLDKSTKENLDRVLDILNAREDIAWAEYMTERHYIPDILGEEECGCSSPSLTWGADKINLSDAHNIQQYASSSVCVGIIDSGIYSSHIEFQIDPMLGTSFVDLSRGVNYTNVELGNDYHGHGTHIAGIIGACGNNSFGFSGVAPNVTLIPLIVWGKAPVNANQEGIIDAIEYADSIGIDILNMSIQLKAEELTSDYISRLRTAIQNFDGLVVCCAGNFSRDIDTNPVYPASFDLPNIITVGSIRSDNQPATYSNYGATSIDIYAPGCSIYSCQSGTQTLPEGYIYRCGTSMATPYVTGAAALILSKYPFMTVSELKDTILQNKQTVLYNGQNMLQGKCVSNGCLDVYAAISSPQHHAHNYEYTYTEGNFSKHTVSCEHCIDTYTESHEWELTYVNSLPEISPNAFPIYKCFACGMTSISNPELMSE